MKIRIILMAFGTYMVGVSLLLLVAPETIKKFTKRFLTGSKRYVWAFIAGSFGLLMLWAAPASRAMLLIQVLGVLAMLKGVLLLALPASALSRFVGWWLGLPRVAYRVWGLAALAIGITILRLV